LSVRSDAELARVEERAPLDRRLLCFEPPAPLEPPDRDRPDLVAIWVSSWSRFVPG
jgi:hypothetical protein